MEERIIDDFRVETAPLPAWQALELGLQLVRMAGPLLQGFTAAKNPAALASAVEGLFRQTPPAEVIAWVKRVMVFTKVQSTTKAAAELREFNKAFDSDFRAKLTTGFKVIAFAVEVNFSDFYERFRAGWARWRELNKDEIASLLGSAEAPPSDGPSGSSSPTDGVPPES